MFIFFNLSELLTTFHENQEKLQSFAFRMTHHTKLFLLLDVRHVDLVNLMISGNHLALEPGIMHDRISHIRFTY